MIGETTIVGEQRTEATDVHGFPHVFSYTMDFQTLPGLHRLPTGAHDRGRPAAVDEPDAVNIDNYARVLGP
ncbi:MAG: hypothetical protein Q7T82_12785 [Armatimonadota bacterium]|nr:hypothetical protein [Armatimonadota bacterium]